MMKKILITLTILGALSALPAKASLTLDIQNINLSSEQSTIISMLDTTPASSNGSIVVESGSLTASDFTSSESIAITVTAVSDWNHSTATMSGDPNNYLSNLTGTDFDGNNGGWGVNGAGSSINDLDALGEAFLLTFDLSNLTVPHQSDFRLTGLGMARTGAGDLFDYAVFDSAGNTISLMATGLDATVSQGDLGLSIGDGDTIVIGFEDGDDFRLGSFGINVVPEPTTFGLMALGAFGWTLRRRRHDAAADNG